jgi:hypothetical protein
VAVDDGLWEVKSRFEEGLAVQTCCQLLATVGFSLNIK